MFCTKCGQKLANEAAYCSACGAIVEKSVAADQGSRKQVYVGEIRKCPNCGEALSAFEVKCHACGFELQNIAGSKAVVELAEAIAALEANRPPQLQTKKNMYEFADISATPTDRSIANIIQSFVIPNTKEDILEFMILASTNIDTEVLDDGQSTDNVSRKLVANAWIAKFEQSYQKAKLAFGDSPEFNNIKIIYDKKQKEIRKGKTKTLRQLAFIMLPFILLCIFLMLFLWFSTNSSKDSPPKNTSTYSQEDSTDSAEERKKYIDEFKKNSKEFREDMDEMNDEIAEIYKSVFDGYKSIFSGIFD